MLCFQVSPSGARERNHQETIWLRGSAWLRSDPPRDQVSPLQRPKLMDRLFFPSILFVCVWIEINAPPVGTKWEGDLNIFTGYLFPFIPWEAGYLAELRAWVLTHSWKDGGRSRGESTTADEEETCAARFGGPEKGEFLNLPHKRSLNVWVWCWQWILEKLMH